MRKLTNTLRAVLTLAGIKATVEFIPGEGGGITVRVGSVADVFAAEPIAAEFEKDYGITTLVCF